MIDFYVPFINTEHAVERYIRVNQNMSNGRIYGVYVECPNYILTDEIRENILNLKDHGITIILNLETSQRMNMEWFENNLNKIEKLIEKWEEMGLYKILVTNTNLIKLILHEFPKIEVIGSYKQNLSSMKQYINLKCELQNIKTFGVACSANHNPKLLKNLTNFCGNNIQLVANNGCRSMCFKTFMHNSWLDHKKSKDLLHETFGRWTEFYNDCFHMYAADFWLNFIMSDMIYPWQLDEYVKTTGVHQFRLISQKNPFATDEEQMNYILFYLDIFEHYESYQNFPFYLINGYLLDKIKYTDITIKDIRQYIPKLDYFEHRTGSCADFCGVSCTRCNQIAKEIEENLKNKTLVFV